MKKKIITVLVAGIATISVGCSTKDSSDKVSDNKESQVEVSVNEDSKKEELYKLHNELLPKVEELFKELNVDYKLKSGNNGIENYKILYRNIEETIPGAIKRAGYEAIIKEKDKANGIGADIFQVLDSENIINNGFKFTESPFYKLSKIFIQQNVDYSEIDDKINEAVKNGAEVIIENDYDNIHERMIVDSKEISYSLHIKP